LDSHQAKSKLIHGGFSWIRYNRNEVEKIHSAEGSDIIFQQKPSSADNHWLNCYGLGNLEQIKEIFKNNGLDEFLLKLLQTTSHRNKIIELNDCFFLSTKVMAVERESDLIAFEQLFFIVGDNFIFSIQEKEGDYFEEIRNRLMQNQGLVRKKKIFYLLYLLLETLTDTYFDSLDMFEAEFLDCFEFENIKATPAVTHRLVKAKNMLAQLRTVSVNLQEVVSQIEKLDDFDINPKYFQELKEQTGMIMDKIDFSSSHLGSNIDLVFSIQNHQMNSIMKALTIISVIFIPLTFIAGIYGMNFKNMPELDSRYGYYIVLGIMFSLVIGIFLYMKKKKWF